ncbi:MAG: ATP-binding cassette domain-containing protein, partial [Alphaproteobacteria bacterium]|nr:ATP-binding cassette domain-containing protein [Alphaproteobacteria bacterium]
MTDQTVLPDAALNVSGLEKSYRLGSEAIPVLKGLELRVDRGDMIAIMGPSGSGKTTLLNCIAAIDAPDCGHVEIAGSAVN